MFVYKSKYLFNMIVVVVLFYIIYIMSSISSTLYYMFFSIKVIIKDVSFFMFVYLLSLNCHRKETRGPKLKFSIRKSKTKFNINKFVLLNFLNNDKATTQNR